MAFSASIVTAVQAQLAKMPTDRVVQLVQAIDVPGGVLVNNNGVITTGGQGLTNLQYQQLYELICDQF